MKIDVIIPYYESNIHKKESLQKCVKSLKGHDNTIIIWNNKMGYAAAINKGLMLSNADFMIIMNDDVELISGNLKDLCKENIVTSPSFMGKIYPYLWGSCICLPYKVYQEIGNLDERYYPAYFEDDDLIFTLLEKKIPMQTIPSVIFDHKHPGLTVDNMPDRNEFYEINKQRFLLKWGRLP